MRMSPFTVTDVRAKVEKRPIERPQQTIFYPSWVRTSHPASCPAVLP